MKGESPMKQNSGSADVNWGGEVGTFFGRIGKILLRILSYFVNILLTVTLIGLITGIIVAGAFAIYVNNYLDLEIDPSLIATATSDSTTRIYYMKYDTMEDRQNRNGTPVEIEDQRLYSEENTIAVSYSQIPDNLVNAFISIEDKRFRSHNGVDWIRTTKAVLDFFLPTGGHGGGSTITQQLIKNVTGEEEVTIQRKVEEIFRALNLERAKSKEQIMEAYLNIIYLENGCDGVQSAANFYFGKDVSELSLVECAAFAAIVKNPSQYEPLYHDKDRIIKDKDGNEKVLEGNESRRWVVLDEMKKNGFITEAECEAAQKEELNVVGNTGEEEENSSDDGMQIFNWYTEALISQLRDDLAEEKGITQSAATNLIYSSGYKIYIPMDPEVQDTIELVYENDDEYFPKTGKGLQPQSAMVVCDPYTGDVLGLVGGRGEKTINRGLNRATQAKRPPGSAIKPIAVYGPALDDGIITYGSVIDDTPVMFNQRASGTSADGSTYYTYDPYPKNLPVIYRGLTTINSGITRSVNTIAMKTLQKLGIDESFDFMKNKLHIDSLVDSYTKSNGEVVTDRGLAALSLGQLNYGLTVEEITSAYAIFQNNGIYNEPKLYLYVKDSDGKTVIANEDDPQIVIKDETASIMTIMLQNVMNYGTGTGCTLRYSVNVAGKTGTTSSDFDRYFVGYTPYYVAGVWTGYDMNQSLSAFGENPSLVVWDKVMTMLHQKYIDEAASGGEALKTFERAAGVIEATYCKDSGKLCTEACALDPRGNRAETGYFTRDTVPTEECDTHVVVKRDTKTNLIASPDCNPADCVDVALIRVEDRSFPSEIYVEDAQYVYREMPSSVKPSGWWGVPFFVNMLSEGEYCGSCYVNTPYNAYCYFHCDYRPWGGNAPAEDSGYTPWEKTDDKEYSDNKETDETDEKKESVTPDTDIIKESTIDETDKITETEESGVSVSPDTDQETVDEELFESETGYETEEDPWMFEDDE